MARTLNNDDSRQDPIKQVRTTLEDAKLESRKTDAFWAGRVMVGRPFLVALVLVVLLGGAQLLPHSEGVSGLDVLFWTEAAQEQGLSLPSRVFVTLFSVGAILFGAITIFTQRWWAAGVAWCASCVAAVYGVLAIWLRQDGRGPNPDVQDFGGPGIGLYLSEILVIALAITFSLLLWSKSEKQIEAEELVREESRKLKEATERREDQQRTADGDAGDDYSPARPED